MGVHCVVYAYIDKLQCVGGLQRRLIDSLSDNGRWRGGRMRIVGGKELVDWKWNLMLGACGRLHLRERAQGFTNPNPILIVNGTMYGQLDFVKLMFCKIEAFLIK